MRKLILPLLALLLALSACQEENEPLDTPSNITENDLEITWESVDGAESYIVEVNDEEAIVNRTSFSLHDYDEGTYAIRVKALNNETESDFSDTLEVDVSHEYPFPDAFTIEDGTLEWEDLDADSYILEVNGEEETVTDNRFPLDAETHYDIRIKAVYPEGESLYSKTVTINNFSQINETYTLQYSLKSGTDPMVYLSGAPESFVMEDEDPLEGDDYQLQGNRLTLDKEAIQSLGEGDHEILFSTEEGLYQIDLEIDDSEAPKVISNTTMTYQEDRDIIVKVETYGEGAHSLSGGSNDNLAEDEYTIDDDTVTIKSGYFERLFEDNPDRSSVIMNLTLNNSDGGLVIFTLFINQD